MLLTGFFTLFVLLLVVLMLLIRAERHRNLALQQSRQANLLLAEIVQQRNEELIQLNTQLINYAQLNSHQVRGPLARIMGLIHLLKQEHDPRKRAQLVEYADQSLCELDDIICEINACLTRTMWEEVPIPGTALMATEAPMPTGNRM